MRTKVSLNRRAVAIFLAVFMVTGMFAYNLGFASADDGSIDPTIDPTEPTSTYDAKTEPLEPQTSPEVPEPSTESKTSPEASKWHETTSEDITEPEPTTEATTEPESKTEEPTTEETTEPTTPEPPPTTEPDENDNIKDEKDGKDEEDEEITSGDECEADEDECECEEEVDAADICEECWDMDLVGPPPHDHCKCDEVVVTPPAREPPVVRIGPLIGESVDFEPMFGIANVDESRFFKSVTPDPDNFREYNVELTFTPANSSITRYENRSIPTTHRSFDSTPFIGDNGTGGIMGSRFSALPTPAWANNWGNLSNIINSINTQITGLGGTPLSTNISHNRTSIFNFNNGRSNGIINGSSGLRFPLYVEWRALRLDDSGNPVSMENVLMQVPYNVRESGNDILDYPRNDSDLGAANPRNFNAFSPILANLWYIGRVENINGVNYMLININHAINPQNGQYHFTYATTPVTTDFNTAQINRIEDAIPTGFELVPNSSVQTSVGSVGSLNEISTLRFVDESWIRYSIRPTNAGTSTDSCISGRNDVSAGDTSFNVTIWNAAGNASNGTTTGSPAVPNAFDVPPLFQIGMTIVGNTQSAKASAMRNDGDYATITSHEHDSATLEPILQIYGTDTPVSGATVAAEYKIPKEWEKYYEPSEYDISMTVVRTEGIGLLPSIPADNIVTDAQVGIYKFTFSARMIKAHNYYPMITHNPLTTEVTLEVIPHIIYRLKVEVHFSSQNGYKVRLDTADVAVKRTNIEARFAGTHGSSRTYIVEDLDTLNAYTVDLYVPYGYHAEADNDIQANDSDASPEEINGVVEDSVVTRTITVTVNPVTLPFYRDIATKQEVTIE